MRDRDRGARRTDEELVREDHGVREAERGLTGGGVGADAARQRDREERRAAVLGQVDDVVVVDVERAGRREQRRVRELERRARGQRRDARRQSGRVRRRHVADEIALEADLGLQELLAADPRDLRRVEAREDQRADERARVRRRVPIRRAEEVGRPRRRRTLRRHEARREGRFVGHLRLKRPSDAARSRGRGTLRRTEKQHRRRRCRHQLVRALSVRARRALTHDLRKCRRGEQHQRSQAKERAQRGDVRGHGARRFSRVEFARTERGAAPRPTCEAVMVGARRVGNVLRAGQRSFIARSGRRVLRMLAKSRWSVNAAAWRRASLRELPTITRAERSDGGACVSTELPPLRSSKLQFASRAVFPTSRRNEVSRSHANP